MSAQVHIPSLGGATEWLNSEPLGPAELRGRVVVVNFWTLDCVFTWTRAGTGGETDDEHLRQDGPPPTSASACTEKPSHPRLASASRAILLRPIAGWRRSARSRADGFRRQSAARALRLNRRPGRSGASCAVGKGG